MNLPAHVVAQRALGIEDPEEATDALVAAIEDDNVEDLSKIAKVVEHRLELRVDAVRQGPPRHQRRVQHHGVRAGPVHHPDRERRTTRATTRPSSTRSRSATTATRWARSQALQNGEVDLINPQATADVKTAVEAIDGIEVAVRPRGHVRARRPAVHQRWSVRPGDLRRRRGEGQEGPPGVPQDHPARADHREPDQAARPDGGDPQLVHAGPRLADVRLHRRGQRPGRGVRDGHPRRHRAARRGRRAGRDGPPALRPGEHAPSERVRAHQGVGRPGRLRRPALHRSRRTGARTSRTRRASTTQRSSAGSRPPPPSPSSDANYRTACDEQLLRVLQPRGRRAVRRAPGRHGPGGPGAASWPRSRPSSSTTRSA